MYTAFFGLREKPFSLLPDPTYLYVSQHHDMALTMLQYALTSRLGIVVISGEVGAGKTTLARHVLGKLGPEYVIGYLSNTHRGLSNLLEWILMSFQLDYRDKSQVEMFELLTGFLSAQHAQGRQVVLIIDEAQNLGAEALEELRVLTNLNVDQMQLLQMVIIGQPELRNILQRDDMLQFAQRVSIDYHLSRLHEADIPSYIDHRVQVAGGAPALFSAEAKQLVTAASKGIPRVINTLCDTALVYAYAEHSQTVTGHIVQQVLQDRMGGSLLPLAGPVNGNERLLANR